MPDRPSPQPAIKLPRVGILVTNYNAAAFLAEAIRAVAVQSHDEFEALIVDDASSDDSIAAIEAVLAELGDPRFALLALPSNRGQMGAIKAGLARLTAPFVCILESDDVWHPRFLERHVAAHLNCAASAGFTSSDMAMIDGEGRLIMGTIPFHGRDRGAAPVDGVKPIEPGFRPRFDAGSAAIAFDPPPEWRHHDAMSWRWPWAGLSSIMFRAAVLDLVMADDEAAFPINADYYLVVFAQFMAGSILVGETLGYYRVHGANHSTRNPILGGDAPFAGRDLSALYIAHRRAIQRKLTREQARFTQAIGAERYRRVVGFLDVELPRESRARGWARRWRKWSPRWPPRVGSR